MATLSDPLAAAPLVDAAPPLDDAAFARIVRFAHEDARLHLTDVKRTLVHSRLSRRLRARGCASFRDYVALVEADGEERRLLVTALTTNHTHFFRESHHFEHLRGELLPRLKSDPARSPVRIWSAGCSSGEEPYSIAMNLLGPERSQAEWLRGRDVRILATDLSEPMVRATASATYAAAAAKSIPEGYRQLWTVAQGETVVMTDTVRSLVSARVLNLFDHWPMRHRYDAIFCRNVTIYFADDDKAVLANRLIDLIVPGGYLYIGHSERLAGPAGERMENVGNTIYRKREDA